MEPLADLGSDYDPRPRMVSVSEGSINLAPPFVDVPNRQSRWTVGFNGTSIKGERVLDEDSALEKNGALLWKIKSQNQRKKLSALLQFLFLLLQL